MGNTCSKNQVAEMKNNIEKEHKLDSVELRYPVFYGVRGLRELSESGKKMEN